MSASVDADGYEDVAAFGDKLVKTMPDRYGTYIEKAGDMTVDKARSNLQNNGNVSTGDLLSSIRVLAIEDQGFSVTVGSDLEYAKWIEKGRGPVAAHEGKTLSWIDKTTGKRIFAKRSGPVDPHPFLEPAVIEMQYLYPQLVTEEEQNYIGEISS